MSGPVSPVAWWVVIVSFNNPELVRQCVNAYRAQTVAPAAILVVDNSEPVLTAADLPSDVKLIAGGSRDRPNSGSAGGFACGMNVAFRAGAETVVLSDQDFIPCANMLEELIRTRRAHPTAVVCALTVDPASLAVMPGWVCRPLADEPGQIWLAPNRHELVSSLGWNVIGPHLNHLDSLRAFATASRADVARVALASPQGLAIPADVYRRVGPFRADFFVGLEDHEYSARLADSGVPIFIALGAVGHHHLVWHRSRRVIGVTLKIYGGSPMRARWAIRNSLILARERAKGALFVRWLAHEAYRSLVFLALGAGKPSIRAREVWRAWSQGLLSPRRGSR